MDYRVGLTRTDRGRRIEVSRELPVPAETAWEILTDVTRWAEWGPPVTDVDYPDRTISPGTAGRVQAVRRLWVPFRVETVREYLWTWTIFGFAPPADGHRVEALGDGRCRVAFELRVWAPWYLPVPLLALRNIARIAARETG